MAANPPRANLWPKLIGLGGLVGILIIAAVAYHQFDAKQSEIEKQINVEASFPAVGTTNGVYQYHVWLEGAEETTKIHRVEVNLDRVPAYAKTVSVSTIGENWEPYSSSGVKGGVKGEPEDDIYLKFQMDDFGYAKSWTLVELTAEVQFELTIFWMGFSPTVDFSFDVPGPYHRRQEGTVKKTVKWTSTDDMTPDNAWETIETIEENQ